MSGVAMPPQAEPIFAADTPPENDPTLDDLAEIASDALAALPVHFRKHIEGVVIRVAEWPETEVLEEMGFESPYDLLGLYQGIALTERGSGEVAPPVDMIFLYRQPLLSYWEDTGHDLRAIVRNTLIHEIGHHFGLSDDEMEALEAAAEAAGADDETADAKDQDKKRQDA